jgi:hypothetical protein
VAFAFGVDDRQTQWAPNFLSFADRLMTPAIGFDQHRSDRDVSASTRMQTTRFDLVTSFLSASILMLVTMVTVLLLLWWFASVSPLPTMNRPARLVSGVSPAAGEREFEIPASAELIELAPPSLHEVLQEVDEAASAVAALPVGAVTPGNSVQGRSGQGHSGHRPFGPDASPRSDPFGGIVPRDQRWVLSFAEGSRIAYARELDFYGIELGVFGGGIAGLDIASKFTAGPEARHLEDPSTERRLYFSWVRPSPLARYERELCNQAGIVREGRKIIVTEGRQILKFLPIELENRLAMMELEYAQSNGVSSVRGIAKTVFRSESVGAGFRFRIVAQRYQRQSPSLASGAPKT